MSLEPDLGERPAELDALPRPTLSSAQRAAVWSRIEATAIALPTAAASGAAAAAGGKVVSAKVAAGIALATLAGGLVTGFLLDRLVFPAAPRVVERVVVQTKEVRVEVPVPAPAPARVDDEPAKAAAPRPKAKVPVVDAVDAERQAVEGVRMALVRRDSASALATLEQLTREYPTGRLVEERDSLRMQALQQAGRDDEAKAAARTYLKRYPNGVFGPTAEAILRDSQ